MKTIDTAARYTPIEVPPHVAKCPICGALIVIEEVRFWASKSGKQLSISVECTTEPDIDSDEWPDWHRGHWSMPYVDWLPVQNFVLKWFQQHYRCI